MHPASNLSSIDHGVSRRISRVWFVLAGLLVTTALACSGLKLPGDDIDDYVITVNPEAMTDYALAQADFSQQVAAIPDMLDDMRELADAIEAIDDEHDMIAQLRDKADELELGLSEYNKGNYTAGAVASRYTQALDQLQSSYAEYEFLARFDRADGLVDEIRTQADAIGGSPPEKTAGLDAADALESAVALVKSSGTTHRPTMIAAYDHAVGALDDLNTYVAGTGPSFVPPYPAWNSTHWDFSSP